MFDEYKITLTLKQEMLGTNPINPEVLKNHIIDKQRKLIMEKSKINKTINKYADAAQITHEQEQEELSLAIAKLEEFLGAPIPDAQRNEIFEGKFESLKETIKEIDSKATTVFYRDDKTGRPLILNHMIYGFLKAAAEAICRTKPREKGQINISQAYTHSIINQHVKVEPRRLVFDMPLAAGYLERPLRAKTAQGDRIALTRSEIVPEGAKLQFTIMILKNSPLTKEALVELLNYGTMRGLGQWRSADYGSFTYEMQ